MTIREMMPAESLDLDEPRELRAGCEVANSLLCRISDADHAARAMEVNQREIERLKWRIAEIEADIELAATKQRMMLMTASTWSKAKGGREVKAAKRQGKLASGGD